MNLLSCSVKGLQRTDRDGEIIRRKECEKVTNGGILWSSGTQKERKVEREIKQGRRRETEKQHKRHK